MNIEWEKNQQQLKKIQQTFNLETIDDAIFVCILSFYALTRGKYQQNEGGSE